MGGLCLQQENDLNFTSPTLGTNGANLDLLVIVRFCHFSPGSRDNTTLSLRHPSFFVMNDFLQLWKNWQSLLEGDWKVWNLVESRAQPCNFILKSSNPLTKKTSVKDRVVHLCYWRDL